MQIPHAGLAGSAKRKAIHSDNHIELHVYYNDVVYAKVPLFRQSGRGLRSSRLT